MKKVCHIHNKEGYKRIKRRVNKGARYLKNRWFDIEYKKAVEAYEAMALAMLTWEIKTGIFGERFEEWRLREC